MASKSRGRGELWELTHIAPIKQGLVEGLTITYADRLRTVLEAFHSREDQGFPGVIRLFRGIHTSQWAMLDGDTRLMLNVVFDGELHGYLRALARDVPGSLALVWSNCEGWKATDQDPQILIDFIERHQVRNNFFYAHQPKLTVPDVESLVRLRDHLEASPDTATVQQLRAALHEHSTPRSSVERAEDAWSANGKRVVSETAFTTVLDRLYVTPEDKEYVRLARGEAFQGSAPKHLSPSPDDERAKQVQAHVLDPAASTYAARMLFLHFDTKNNEDLQTAVREWLRQLRGAVRFFGPHKANGPHLTIGFTHKGLKALGVDAAVLSEFPEAFVQGMDSRSRGLLDDPKREHKRPWTQVRDHTAEIHAVISVHAEAQPGSALFEALVSAGQSARDAACDRAGSSKRDAAGQANVLIQLLNTHLDLARSASPLHELPKCVDELGHQDLHLPLVRDADEQEHYGIEYFGFRDGVGQPRLPTDPGPDDGHKAASFDSVLVAKGRGLLRNATYMVVRQLLQHPESFWDSMGTEAQKLELSKRKLAEMIVGRQMDGRRLGRLDTPFDPKIDRDAFEPNKASSCPLHSHARRMNPRSESDLGHNPQLVRRSLPYVRQDDDGLKQGLMFIAYNANIETQFELIQRHWGQAGNQVGLSSSDRDALVGLSTEQVPTARFYAELPPDASGNPDPRARELRFSKGFVELEWGLYLFIPAQDALNSL